MMNNRDIYQKDPATRKLVNEGVASVNDEKTSQALAVLRYELETFVCDGQYEKGMSHVLETYLKNIDQAQQPAVWVSGFYGSGKSHLVKMLRALWVDTEFSDGASARGIAHLPESVAEGQPFSFQVTGDLTILGVAVPVTFDMNVTPISTTELTGSGSATVRWADFGISIPSVPMVAGVSDDVRLEIDFTALASS